ncbi:DUF871 domain-containing protein [Heyndrickxia camelliae]|uniref:DUF871 domain-containing protein n=1 Tax=Heyndrickxia camelliae TaxID=1707093 RepID=A0A2N3LJE8_9BACI|nr:MupG family TIM beta-alpha barrel fold protein [Heyndrickxia camelliae]PKR84751.1 DUF871 domain-containing protein [Heyndrickxia camelliae]
MLGLSVYLSEPIENQREYILKVAEKGFRSIFTSLHIPEDNPSVYEERLKELGRIAKSKGLELVADISPKSMDYLGYTWDSAPELLDWGLTGLRVDYGIKEEDIAALSKKMKVALNASTITQKSLARLKSFGLKIDAVEAWHNYYPRPETGLDRKEFRKKNQWLKSEGIKTMAFIPGDKKLRGPLYMGLPTLEDHRYQSPFSAFYDFIINEEIDKVLVGDFELSEKSLDQFQKYNEEGYLLLRAKAYTVDKKILQFLESVQTNRWDSARDCIRSMESREYGLVGTESLDPFNTIEREIGSITIDNLHYGRYKGEIQITKRHLKADEKVNVIGKIIPEDLLLLPLIKGGTNFKIQWL